MQMVDKYIINLFQDFIHKKNCFRISGMRVQCEEMFPLTTRRLCWHRQSQDDMSAQSLAGAHRGGVCARS